MSGNGQLPAGECGLGSDCQAWDKMWQQQYICCHCNCNLHGFFCANVTEDDDGTMTIKCLDGKGCRSKGGSTKPSGDHLQQEEDISTSLLDLTQTDTAATENMDCMSSMGDSSKVKNPMVEGQVQCSSISTF